MRKITAIRVGAWQHEAGTYAPYSLSNPELIQFFAVVDADQLRREIFRKCHHI
ncbi:hypothetical protein [Paenibacillus macquariensis]|uniref:hypothetical protein n=1 Tax=Paenibacillus macquariensis TaxID=948756 RepID=UPI000AF6B1E2|nr:hypothetical protein [Paenibacillus macquariensis]MEC0090862.1 hypothetical protein [Paenibacillus macquariensis]